MSTVQSEGIPEGLIDSVVSLVNTGPVPLGAYTLAEIAAVSGVIDFLEREPDAALVAEAVRSLAARNLITTAPGEQELEVRGDLGIALAFQERSRLALDARVTGTGPDEPWRFLLLPQPEGISLEISIDALGIHFYALRTTSEALDRLGERLPRGERAGTGEPEAVLAAAARTALVTVTRWTDDGTRESSDLAMAESEGFHAFVRDPSEPSRLKSEDLDADGTRELIRSMLAAGS